MEWQPIETAPRNGTEILTIRDNGFIAKAVWYDNPFGRKDTVIENASGKWWSVTHWMPLPPAPGDARADLTPSPEVVKELVEAAKALNGIIEGIQGAMEHGTWRDEKGQRLKDTPEWVAFYNARAALAKLEAWE